MRVKLIFLGTAGYLLSACSTIMEPVAPSYPDPRIYTKTYNQFMQVNSSGGDRPIGSSEHQALKARLLLEGNEVNRMAYGNLLIEASDDTCSGYMENITRSDKFSRSVIGVSAIALSTVGGLIKPVSTANIVSGAATASIAAKDEVSDIVLNGNNGDILVNAVFKGRAEAKPKLLEILNEDFGAFVSSFDTYHEKCGIAYGLGIIKKSVDDLKPGDINKTENVTSGTSAENAVVTITSSGKSKNYKNLVLY